MAGPGRDAGKDSTQLGPVNQTTLSWVYDSPAMSPFPSFPMHQMSKLEWVLNNPEWVNVLATSLFALITGGIIATQAIVSSRAQHRQNQLLQYQLEYARMKSLNIVREEVLSLVSNLRVRLRLAEQGSGGERWDNLRDVVFELWDKVNTLDYSIFSGYYDGWYVNLSHYMDDIFEAVANDNKTDSSTGRCPTATTVRLFNESESTWNPLNIALEIKTAIRTTANVFYQKWNALLPLD